MRLNLDIGYRDVDGKNERSCRDVKKKKKEQGSKSVNTISSKNMNTVENKNVVDIPVTYFF